MGPGLLARTPLPSGTHFERVTSTFSPCPIAARGGLGGPTRADRIETGAPRDFVSFVRNIGQPSDKHGNGGTYGYGKGSFYGFSHARTILIDTQTLRAGNVERRLIGAALGKESHSSSGVAFTSRTRGRHWWGEMRDGVPEPLTGAQAHDVASEIGLPSFNVGETGTSITIIDPAFEGEPAAELSLMAEALVWWAWPLLVPNEHGIRPVTASMSWNGSPIEVVEPSRHRVLRTFVEAYQTATTGKSIPISTTTHKIGEMGRLGVHRKIADDGREPSPESPIETTVHHVALMRAPRLIVKYERVSPLPVDGVDFAGVFVANSLHDGAFAKSEPPTHDDWVSSQLQGTDKTVVRTSLAHIKDEMKKRLVVDGPKQPGGMDPASMAAASAMFAGLVGGTAGNKASELGTIPEGGDGLGGRGGDTGHATVRLESLEYADDGSAALIATFSVSGTLDGACELQVDADIAIDSGRESRPPIGAETPVVLDVVGPDGIRRQGATAPLAKGSDGTWLARIIPVGDTVTEVAARILR